jgi:hypothetical protein
MNTQNMQEVLERARAYAARCHDEATETRRIAFDPSGQVKMAVEGEMRSLKFVAQTEAHPTDWALSQMAERLAGPAGWIGREQDIPLRSEVMNALLRFRDGDTKWLMRLRENEGVIPPSTEIRAALSEKYTKFDNVGFLEMVARGVDELGTEVQIHRAETGDDLRAYILLPKISFPEKPGGEITPPPPPDDGIALGHTFDYGNGGLHPAIYIRNSEIGGGSARVHGAIFRAVCSNGAIIGWSLDEGVGARVIHTHKSEAAIWAIISSAIVDALKMSEEAAKRFIDAQMVQVPKADLKGIVNGWVAKYGLSVEFGENWLGAITGNAAEYDRSQAPTLFDVINGATLTAQGLGGMQREQAEVMAGAILVPPTALDRAELAGERRGRNERGIR